MLFMSVFVALWVFIFEYLMFTNDWWRPDTITGTRVGIEAFLLGFTNGGIGAVLFEYINNKRTRSIRKDSRLGLFFKQHPYLIWLPYLVGIAFMVIGYFVLDFHSFWATFIGLALTVIIILIIRHDLIIDSIIGGISMLLVAIPVYLIIMHYFPGVVDKFWYLDLLSGILILGIPIEELLIYFTGGMLAAPSYEFIFKKRLVKK